MDNNQSRNVRMSQKNPSSATLERQFKPYPSASMAPLGSQHHQSVNEKDYQGKNNLDIEQITKDFESVLFQNQRYSEPMCPPIQMKKQYMKSSMNLPDAADQDQYLVINSDKRKSMDIMIEAQDIQKLKQKVRQLSMKNDNLKEQNLQLRLQKMRLASNSQAMQLLQLKMEMQETNKRIAILEKQRQEAMKRAGLISNEKEFQNRNLTSNSKSDWNLLANIQTKQQFSEVHQFHALPHHSSNHFQFCNQNIPK